jgi:hypothetical protein
MLRVSNHGGRFCASFGMFFQFFNYLRISSEVPTKR